MRAHAHMPLSNAFTHTHTNAQAHAHTAKSYTHTQTHACTHAHIHTHIYAPNTDIHWGGTRSAGSVRTTFANVFYTEGVMGLTAGMPQVCL